MIKMFTVSGKGPRVAYHRSVDNAGNLVQGSIFIYFPPQSVPYLYGNTTSVMTPTSSPVPTDTPTPTPAPTQTPAPVVPATGPSVADNGTQWNSLGILLLLLLLAIICGVVVYFTALKPK